MRRVKKTKNNINYETQGEYKEQKQYEFGEFLRDIFDVIFWWNWDMAYKPFKIISLIVVRLFIYFIGNKYYDSHLIYVETFFSGNFFLAGSLRASPSRLPLRSLRSLLYYF